MFSNSRNVLISGNSHLTYIDHRNSLSSELLNDGTRLLLSRVVKGAMHNSGERFDAPTCHPETRIALQDDILGWADEPVDGMNEIVTWLYGPAGSGKSAIAQTIAEKLHDRDQLTASFFFSRASGGQGRGAETDLIATLAYQLSQSVPATQPYIAATVQKNPLVLDLALQDQVNALIVAPLIAASHPSSRTERPRVIVVDGLDECRQEKDAQRRVVNALISGLRQIPYHAHKLFIASRPEHNIVSIFSSHEQKILRKMELDNRWNPDEDIRTFLLAGFADLRRFHFYFQIHPADKTWPSPEDVQTLVRRSSGQFIYASVALKYIKSEENYSPVTRLETILNVNNNEDQPYAELDVLYHHIFSQIPGVETVLTILSLERLHQSNHSNPYFRPPLGSFLSEVLGLDKGLVVFRLRPLKSLLIWSEQHGIRYNHASLPDFLLDESRSGDFCINSVSIAVAMVSRALKCFENEIALKNLRSQAFLLEIPAYYARILPPDQKFHVWTLLSSFNIVEIELCKHGIEYYKSNGMLEGVSGYLNWVVAESERYNDASRYLSQPVAQILTWFVNKLELMNINNFDGPQVDIYPFFMTGSQPTSAKDVFSKLASVLEILQYPRLQGMKVEASHLNQIVVLCCCLRHLDWLGRSDLLGQYTMTTERYGVALKCTAYYLLRLPERRLLEILETPRLKFQYAAGADILSTIVTILPAFLVRSPETADLCFLMALIYPVMVTFGGVRLVSACLQQAVKKFPFLVDPLSEDYIQASAKVKGVLVDSKIKTHLHEVAERKELTWLFEERLPYKSLLETFTVIDSRRSESCDRIEEP